MKERKSRIETCGGVGGCSQSPGGMPSCDTETFGSSLDAPAVVSLDRMQLGACSDASTAMSKKFRRTNYFLSPNMSRDHGLTITPRPNSGAVILPSLLNSNNLEVMAALPQTVLVFGSVLTELLLHSDSSVAVLALASSHCRARPSFELGTPTTLPLPRSSLWKAKPVANPLAVSVPPIIQDPQPTLAPILALTALGEVEPSLSEAPLLDKRKGKQLARGGEELPFGAHTLERSFHEWLQKLIEASLRQQKKLESMSAHVPSYLPERMTIINQETSKCWLPETSKPEHGLRSSNLEEEPAVLPKAGPRAPPVTTKMISGLKARVEEKKGRGSPLLWYITSEELDSLSSYMRGRLTLDKVNATINDMSAYAEANAQLITAPRKKLAESMLDRALVSTLFPGHTI
ncbi:hypothetical protein Acr_14g0003980 [Actinidia rufa]|uniref:Uncharacterized protein n=1 Tax=Actinidia rufa TaxID=165716 RepID=A0A7J0FPW5_9ERIC|nr:hypothetical protein Acr_14g0003980 [Actinidia rufa]